MLTKDHLKLVFSGNKRFLELCEVKFTNVPNYDELSVKSLWPELSQDPEFMSFMPGQLPKGKVCDKKYFFNVLNTVHPEYCQ